MSWKALAANVRWNVQPFINGRYRASRSGEGFHNINPATETTLCEVAVGNSSDVDDAVRIARQRFNDGSWSDVPPARRRDVLFKLADLIVENRAELALLDSLEMGRPIQSTLNDGKVFAPGLLRSWAGFADKLVGTSAPLSSETMSVNVYEPRGVIGAITPWNFPLVNAVYKIGPALAAGNTLVLKPSELAPSSALRIAELALEAGIPEGVLNVVPGLGTTTGEALALHPDVDMLSFTGSTATGRKLMEYSGRSNGKPLLLELGGKSPHVVFSDVSDLDSVADAVAQQALWNQGQVCSAHTRLVVHEEIKDALVEKVVIRMRAVAPNDPLDERTTFGPLASSAQRDRVSAYVDQGLAAGARPVLPGRIQESNGCYVWPTVFDNVDTTMSIAREEIFGPVLCVQAFVTEDDAIRIANAPDYGLVATAWTRDSGRGRRLARHIRAGIVSVRTSGAEGEPSGTTLSYEPQKASGFGSETGLRGLQSYSTLKLITFNGN